MNFTPVTREGYRIGVHNPNGYVELLNSDAEIYGGSNIGNAGFVMSEPTPEHGRSHSVALSLPPLSIIILKPQP